MKKILREGFTTGSALAAAAKAATELLLVAQQDHIPLPTLAPVSIPLPPFTTDNASAQPTPKRYSVPLHAQKVHELACAPQSLFAEVSIIKDGGDDPDATHKAVITLWASFTPFTPEICATLELKKNTHTPQFPLTPLLLPTSHALLTLYAGYGIGTVTLAGLPVAQGEPAINPVPRIQFAKAVEEALRKHQCHTPLYFWAQVAQGDTIAQKTLNPKLGIMGGISILGTQGTVRPYSHDAWKATISQGLDVAKAAHLHHILFSTGRRSERALFSIYPHLPPLSGIQAADFAAFSLKQAVVKGITHISWGCYLGKLLKLAQNLEYTHAKEAPADLHLLARLAATHHIPESLCTAITHMPTATGAFALLEEQAPHIWLNVLNSLCEIAYANMLRWCQEQANASSLPCPHVTLHIFSMKNTLLHTHTSAS